VNDPYNYESVDATR